MWYQSKERDNHYSSYQDFLAWEFRGPIKKLKGGYEGEKGITV